MVIASGVGFAGIAAVTASSTTAAAFSTAAPLGISSMGGDVPTGSATASPEQLAEQRSQALTTQAEQINAAAANAVADQRSTLLNQDATSLSTENDRLRNLSRFLWPTDGGVGSRFGMRLHPILHIWRMHDGDDIGGTCGQPIWAAQSGTVVKAEMGYNGGSGNNVWLDNGNVNGVDVQSGYLHMQGYTVTVGEHVNKGDVIGHVGSTGLSTACHLHFSIKKDGNQSDPMEYIGWNADATKAAAKSAKQ